LPVACCPRRKSNLCLCKKPLLLPFTYGLVERNLCFCKQGKRAQGHKGTRGRCFYSYKIKNALITMTMVEVMFGLKKPLLLQETFAFARKAKGQKGNRGKFTLALQLCSSLASFALNSQATFLLLNQTQEKKGRPERRGKQV